MTKMNETAREQKKEKLIRELGVRCGENQELRKQVVLEVLELAKARTKKGTKNTNAWAHTIPAIEAKIIEKYFEPKKEKSEEDYLAMADGAWEEQKKRDEKKAKKAKKVEA